MSGAKSPNLSSLQEGKVLGAMPVLSSGSFCLPSPQVVGVPPVGRQKGPPQACFPWQGAQGVVWFDHFQVGRLQSILPDLTM